MTIDEIVIYLKDIVWGPWMLVLLLGTGIYLSIRVGFLQFRKFGYAMKNTFGKSIAVTLFGESHGEYIGAVLDGLAPGIPIDHNYIAHMLTLRRPAGKISTARL